MVNDTYHPEQRARLKAQRDADQDPQNREAYALAERAGFDWYDTESAARHMASHAAGEILALKASQPNSYVDIVFDGPPGPACHLVEVEDTDGKSIRYGEWIERTDGYWALRVPR
jgi:hypothetical protein